ncbi:hypothetical protein [Lacimicrobium alkaliphilum]|uniref:Uncharacterized protein n=1 Tax=Lacimicrobium alkaliphilum TaxID=1526571 RepID=A0A0U2ZIH9_9ALTE|nr:hypothetical protein [Lacimicrobium alkaliphilum]ALS98124.1 hypothetical protein AT746_07510 [Lacimicrobium alkaliphilum]
MKISLIAVIALPLLFACQAESNTPSQTQNANQASENMNTQASEKETIRFTAEVVFKNLEGGFFALIAKDGSKYQPMGLAQEFRRHGLIVEVEAEKVTDMVTYQQFGTLVRIINIKILDESGVRSSGITH